MLLQRTESARLFEEIARVVAGGESSYARLRAGTPLVVERAAGAWIEDVDGNRYIDYCGGYGVNLFGHNPSFVWEAVREVVEDVGVHFAFPHRLYGTVGELVAELVPSIEQIRFANSGTEATQAALRLIRAATGRDVVLVFDGHYHGWADPVAAKLTAGNVVRPVSAGVPQSAVESLRVTAWNDPAELAEAVAEVGDRLAGSICELFPGSGGLVEPAPGYLELLCSTVRGAGGLVVFDEVMTGFRLAPGGAQQLLDVYPDVTVLGKVIGGGTALAAFGGNREVMKVEAENRVVHGGTYTGSPLTLAAAAATLTQIAAEPELYDQLERNSARLAAGIENALEAGGDGHVRRVGSMLQPFTAPRPENEPRSIAEVATLQDTVRYEALCNALERVGVYAHRWGLGRWFVSTAHDGVVIDETISRVEEAVEAML